MSSLSIICNGLGMIMVLMKFVNAIHMNDRNTNILALLLQFVASITIWWTPFELNRLKSIPVCCYVIVVVAMGVMSKDREWMPRPDHNQVSWSFAFAVIGGFFTIFSFFHLIIHYFVYTWAPNVKHKGKSDYSELPLRDTAGSTIYKSQQSSGFGAYPSGGSNLYSQAGVKPNPMVGVTSGATASAKVREAMSQKVTWIPLRFDFGWFPLADFWGWVSCCGATLRWGTIDGLLSDCGMGADIIGCGVVDVDSRFYLGLMR